jgi:hypothetical protein
LADFVKAWFVLFALSALATALALLVGGLR